MITLGEIKNEIEAAVAVKDISIKSSKNDMAVWRGLYCKLACELTSKSLAKIGAFVNIRAHATVTHWRNTFEDLYLSRPDLKELHDFVWMRLDRLDRIRYAVVRIEAQAEEIVENMIDGTENRK